MLPKADRRHRFQVVDDQAVSCKGGWYGRISIQAPDRPDILDSRLNGFAVLERTAREGFLAVVVIEDGGISWADIPDRQLTAFLPPGEIAELLQTVRSRAS